MKTARPSKKRISEQPHPWDWKHPLETPCDLCESAALNLVARSWESKFRMPAIQKILADDGQLQVFDRHPAQANIQFQVARHGASHPVGDIVKHIDIAQRGV